MDFELTGKTAIVTGGSRGIGKAIARQLALEGVDVAIAARDVVRLQAAANEVGMETGRKIMPVQVDTGDDASVRQMVESVAMSFGHVDILVNNAATPGGGTPPSLQDITTEQFAPAMNQKAMGYLRCARDVAPYMRQQGWGRIINISGLAARQSGNCLVSMRNAAIVAMAKNLADELGPYGINVTVVHPGLTRTERTLETLTAQAARLGITEVEAERRMVQEGPSTNSIKRMIDARDIAYIVAFLASPRSIAINGDSIAAGGGVGRAIHY